MPYEPFSKNLIRRIKTDVIGQQTVVGPDPVNSGSSQPVIIKQFGASNLPVTDLFEMILQELKLISFYLKEMPWQLNVGQNFKETIDDFVGQNVDKITNS